MDWSTEGGKMDWSKSTIRNPTLKADREKEFQEWVEEDEVRIRESGYSESEQRRKQRLEKYAEELMMNPLEEDVKEDDFDYTNEELEKCCLQFPVVVKIRGDVLHRSTLIYLKQHYKNVPFNEAPPEAFEKVERYLRKNWQKIQRKFDKYRTVDEYLKARALARGNFNYHVKRSWIEERRKVNNSELETTPSVGREEEVVSVSDASAGMSDDDLNNTVIPSQNNQQSDVLDNPPAQEYNINEFVFESAPDSYTGFRDGVNVISTQI